MSMESLVRPWVGKPDLYQYVRPFPERKPPGEDEDGTVTFGLPSRWTFGSSATVDLPQNPERDVPDDPVEDDNPEDPGDVVFTEIERTTSNVRVENPDDSNQYVIVARITSIKFRGPDNRVYRYDLNPPD